MDRLNEIAILSNQPTRPIQSNSPHALSSHPTDSILTYPCIAQRAFRNRHRCLTIKDLATMVVDAVQPKQLFILIPSPRPPGRPTRRAFLRTSPPARFPFFARRRRAPLLDLNRLGFLAIALELQFCVVSSIRDGSARTDVLVGSSSFFLGRCCRGGTLCFCTFVCRAGITVGFLLQCYAWRAESHRFDCAGCVFHFERWLTVTVWRC